MRPYYVWLLSVLLFFCTSCGFIRKTGTTEKIVQKIKIDTLITIRPAFMPVTVHFPIWDTARAENPYSTAVSYIDIVTGRIVLTLTGKLFSVPVQMVKENITDKKDFTNSRKPNVLAWIFAILLVLLVFYILSIINRRLPKIFIL